ncbi:MAG: PorP/SprF family type IX secretion system membrane protein [Bacteroidota bacterium]
MKQSFILFLLGVILFGCSATAQVDPHFSQFYSFPLSMNPGMTGVMEEDLRLTAIHRSQWGSIMVPFSTQGVSVEWKAKKDWQFGLCLLNQEAGDGGYHYLNGYASLAYRGVRWGSNQLVVGLTAGQISRRFDPLKFQFGDQWSPITGYDPNVQTGDVLARTSAATLDVGMGLFYWDDGAVRSVRPFGGASILHLTRPQDPFISSSVTQRLPYLLLVQAGFSWQAGEQFSLTPHLLYMRQGSATEKMVVVAGNYWVGEDLRLMPSLGLRLGDAVVPGFGLGWRNWSFASSYDLSTGSLGLVGPGGRSVEFSLRFASRIAKQGDFLPCPRF